MREKMRKYRVTLLLESYLQIDIEADGEEKAYEIANRTDIQEFKEKSSDLTNIECIEV